MVNHHELQPTIRVGKNGLTENILNDIKRQLRQRKVIKVKLLKAYLDTVDRKAALDELVEKSGGKLVHKVGGVIVLEKHGV